MSNTNPKLKIKYAQGLGDFIASVLHSKYISWLPKMITGQEGPCLSCSQRINALNILFPIPFWRLFFRKPEDVISSMAQDYKNNGYDVIISPDGKRLDTRKITQEYLAPSNVEPNQSEPVQKYPPVEEDSSSEYVLISSGDNKIDNLLIRTQIFKYKN